MNNSRAIFVNGEWKEVKSCVSCKYSCHESGRAATTMSDTETAPQMNSGCPLPLWGRVKIHWADEIPKLEKGKLPFCVIRQQSDCGIITKFIGMSNPEYINFQEKIWRIDIISWKYLDI